MFWYISDRGAAVKGGAPVSAVYLPRGRGVGVECGAGAWVPRRGVPLPTPPCSGQASRPLSRTCPTPAPTWPVPSTRLTPTSVCTPACAGSTPGTSRPRTYPHLPVCTGTRPSTPLCRLEPVFPPTCPMHTRTAPTGPAPAHACPHVSQARSRLPVPIHPPPYILTPVLACPCPLPQARGSPGPTHMMQPRAQMSDWQECPLLEMTSGARKFGVPQSTLGGDDGGLGNAGARVPGRPRPRPRALRVPVAAAPRPHPGSQPQVSNL